jgi:hypothetical protein
MLTGRNLHYVSVGSLMEFAFRLPRIHDIPVQRGSHNA